MTGFPRSIVFAAALVGCIVMWGAARAQAAVLFSTYSPGDNSTYYASPTVTIDYATPGSGFGATYWHFISFQWTVTEPVSPTVVKMPAIVNQTLQTNITVEVRTGNGPFAGSSVATGSIPWTDHQVGSTTEYTGSMISGGPISPGTYYVLVEYYSIAPLTSGSVETFASKIPSAGNAYFTDYYASLGSGYSPDVLDYLPAIQIEDDTVAPEPASMALIGLGAVALLCRDRRQAC